MNDVVKFLTDNLIQYVATIGLDGKPKVRPFQFTLEQDGKLYYCTSNQKDVFKELQQNPYIEISTTSPESVWIRLKGKAVFTSELSIKTTILERYPAIQGIYQNAENPVFEVFYLEEAVATFYDFTGNPPKEIQL